MREKQCTLCGKNFTKHKDYSIKQWELQKLCSLECRNKSYIKGGKRTKESSRFLAKKVAMNVMGRSMKPGEVVHHIDEDPYNNEPNNLFVFKHTAAHTRWHHFLRRHGLNGLIESNLQLRKEIKLYAI